MIERIFPRAIDSTMLSAYSACEVEFELAHLQNWRLENESIHLHAGAAYAKGMEVARKTYLATGDTFEAENAGFAALIENYGDYDAGTEAKSCDRMVGAMQHYFDTWPLDGDSAEVLTLAGQPGVEFCFAIPLPIKHPVSDEPILFSGRCDAIVKFGGGNYALDDKTTSQLGPQWSRQWELRGQFLGYAWAMREFGLKPSGTIVRGVSILKTKYDHAEAILHQPDWRIDKWYQSTLQKIERMKRDWVEPSTVYNFSESCNAYGSCPYKGACQARNPEDWLRTYYVQKVWDPLERTENGLAVSK